MAEPSDRLVWVDLEMTGLDPERCAIVEIATIVTDANLRVLEEGPNLVIHQPPEVLATMNDFVRDLHARSGLLERIADLDGLARRRRRRDAGLRAAARDERDGAALRQLRVEGSRVPRALHARVRRPTCITA